MLELIKTIKSFKLLSSNKPKSSKKRKKELVLNDISISLWSSLVYHFICEVVFILASIHPYLFHNVIFAHYLIFFRCNNHSIFTFIPFHFRKLTTVLLFKHGRTFITCFLTLFWKCTFWSISFLFTISN